MALLTISLFKISVLVFQICCWAWIWFEPRPFSFSVFFFLYYKHRIADCNSVGKKKKNMDCWRCYPSFNLKDLTVSLILASFGHMHKYNGLSSYLAGFTKWPVTLNQWMQIFYFFFYWERVYSSANCVITWLMAMTKMDNRQTNIPK